MTRRIVPPGQLSCCYCGDSRRANVDRQENVMRFERSDITEDKNHQREAEERERVS